MIGMEEHKQDLERAGRCAYNATELWRSWCGDVNHTTVNLFVWHRGCDLGKSSRLFKGEIGRQFARRKRVLVSDTTSR